MSRTPVIVTVIVAVAERQEGKPRLDLSLSLPPPLSLPLPLSLSLLLAPRPFLGVLLLGDVGGAALGLEGGGLVGVELDVAGPLGGGVGVGVDGLDRARG